MPGGGLRRAGSGSTKRKTRAVALLYLWARVARTLLTGLGIALGVATMVSIGITRASAEEGHYRLVAGEPLTGQQGQDHPILLTHNHADTLELEVGDELELITPEKAVRFTLVGLIAREGLGRLNRGEVGITLLDIAQRDFGYQREISQIDVVAEPGVDVDALQAQFQRALGDRYEVIRPASKGALVDQILQNLLMHYAN